MAIEVQLGYYYGILLDTVHIVGKVVEMDEMNYMIEVYDTNKPHTPERTVIAKSLDSDCYTIISNELGEVKKGIIKRVLTNGT